MNRILDSFRLKKEKEDFETIVESIDKDVVFKGTNLWVLVFAIFLASLGLNVNSTAVIIGAMLISPLMGPIIGFGLGVAINDLVLLRKALFNYLFAVSVALITSTIYFLLSPISDAHSEILARISPNIYDVLIAFFGGFAGILAVSSKQKGNVIPGVAIATALMPPLCTAGYGLATWQFKFFFGAIYLFIINTVFIALATFITTRFLKFPYVHLPRKEDEVRAEKIAWTIILMTLLPSIYFGYDIVQQNKFQQGANKFIEYEGVFQNDYLLQKNIDAKNKTITLTYGGEIISDKAIETLKGKLPGYNLLDTKLEIRQGFAYLQEDNNDAQTNQLAAALSAKEAENQVLKGELTNIESKNKLGAQIYEELKTQYQDIVGLVLQPALNNIDGEQAQVWIAIIKSGEVLSEDDKAKIREFLKVRIGANDLKIYFE